ncbi:alcohol dehydrogenase (NADP+) [Acrasis kona]|uniref:Alcohol dehydrogenase (NADP+) n=1 Tax=Acrasis kona TaxID=1008807 RepID=A0AAW2Z9A9_9EUKA
MKTFGYAVDGPDSKFRTFEFERRELNDDDVLLDVLYAGICHSDIHQVKNEWGNSQYPMVPGHEILGRVVRVGSKATKLKEGDLAGIGCMVDSCKKCKFCESGDEHVCVDTPVYTYNSNERESSEPTYGGYSNQIVCKERFVVKVSDKFTNLEGVAPLLCAGITTYSPLFRFKHLCTPGKKVAIVGLGGLGHMGVKFAAALGAEVTIISTSSSKEADAKKLGATKFINSKEKGAFNKHVAEFDLVLDTVSAQHDLTEYLRVLAPFGSYIIVGAPPKPYDLAAFTLLNGNKMVVGSGIGGMRETQEMIDFCAEHDITSDVEVIQASPETLETAYDRTSKSDVKYRFVIDGKSLKPQQ